MSQSTKPCIEEQKKARDSPAQMGMVGQAFRAALFSEKNVPAKDLKKRAVVVSLFD